METFCWYVLLKKVFVDEICLEVVWASLKNLCELIGSPYSPILFNRKSVKNKFVHGKSTQTRSRTKKRKNCNHWEGNTANSFLSKRKRCESILSKKTPVKNSLKKNNEVNLKYWGTQENKLSVMVTPWEKKCYLEIHWNQFRYWKSQKKFHSREIQKRELRSQKKHGSWFLPRKSQKNHFQQSEKTLFENCNIEKKEFFIFLRDLEEQNMLIGKSCTKFVLKVLLEISFMVKSSVEIVLIQKISWKPY